MRFIMLKQIGNFEQLIRFSGTQKVERTEKYDN